MTAVIKFRTAHFKSFTILGMLFACMHIANAGLFDNKLNTYNCKTDIDAQSCSGSCTKEQGYEVDFLINKNDKSVMMRSYENGKPEGSSVFENCKIFDKNNWDCSETAEYTNAVSTHKRKMNAGVFYSSSSIASLNPTVSYKTLYFSCAK